MRTFVRVVCLLSLMMTADVAGADHPLREAVECRPRGGLANVLAKLERAGVVKIAYLGGSITAQPGWRVKSRQWFQKQHPKADVQEIHAAIGGTGSDLGVFRLGQDVLRHKPDLLFVEFAVNDGGASAKRIAQAMEGIVRQTWRANPRIDICFVYTLAERDLKDLHVGHFQRSASVMETVADHYGIPSIHMGLRVAQMEKAGELIFRGARESSSASNGPMVFSHDGVHPLVNTGHELYLKSIVRSMDEIEGRGKPGDHALPDPLRVDNWEKAKLVPLLSEMLSGPWQKLPSTHSVAKRFERNMPEMYMAEPGCSIQFKFRGTQVGVFDIMGPDGGAIRIELDDRPAQKRRRMDGYCTYHRMSKLTVAQGLPDAKHTVTLTLLDDPLDRREILFERNRHDFDEHPEKYEDSRWYVGAMMLIGTLQ